MAPNVSLHTPDKKMVIVVVGLGMVGLSFIEKILEYDTNCHYQIVTFSEENLRKMSKYFCTVAASA
jgi:NAD(P)H-nitrite reductase large subunit